MTHTQPPGGDPNEGWHRALNAERRAARDARRTASALRAELTDAHARIRELEGTSQLVVIRGRRRARRTGEAA